MYAIHYSRKTVEDYTYVIACTFKMQALFDHFSCLTCAVTLQEYVEFCLCAKVYLCFFFNALLQQCVGQFRFHTSSGSHLCPQN